ncbi:MAG: Asp-tRNA(Asn)/Glu-tRNA(Gln) amidotransferase subunit GatB [Bacillota bacterium]
MPYEVVIGLEIHLELQTLSKLFCGCSTAFSREPNTNCCPVCLGLPGSLPVFNKRAIELAVMAALILNSEIQEKSRFDRKNYFYPDLPKAYQVSQYDRPLARGGYLEIETENGVRCIGLERVHLEEEAGKLQHAGDSIYQADYSLVDYNRAGIPLLEIVTVPQLNSGREARLFLEDLRLTMLYAGVSDCKMEEGSLRCDANISLRPIGSEKLGTKAEVKNMNSFRSVEMALDYEIERQRKLLDAGKRVVQETCHWDEENKKTISLRDKEESSDYRYFPEPDLLPLRLASAFINKLASSMPELPRERRVRLCEKYGLDKETAALLTANQELGNLFEETAGFYNDFKNLANWIQGDLLFQLRESGKEAQDIKPQLLAELLNLLDQSIINRPVAKELLIEVIREGKSPQKLVEERGLTLISGSQELVPLVEQVIAENPEAVNSYCSGKEKALGYLFGRVMSLTGGRADPGEVNRFLKEKLKERN